MDMDKFSKMYIRFGVSVLTGISTALSSIERLDEFAVIADSSATCEACNEQKIENEKKERKM